MIIYEKYKTSNIKINLIVNKFVTQNNYTNFNISKLSITKFFDLKLSYILLFSYITINYNKFKYCQYI